jgi:type IV pilus assembly protein PilV
MLFEALVSVLIFSIGVLGILGMMAVAIKNNSAAKYRVDACLLANELIGQMWADDRTPATLLANYQGGAGLLADYQGVAGTDGAKYTAWLADIVTNNRLPGVAAGDVRMPTVTVTPIDGSAPPATAKSQVTIKLFWKLPGEETPPPASLCYPHPHCYVAVTQIK